jgi:hypothetical protein
MSIWPIILLYWVFYSSKSKSLLHYCWRYFEERTFLLQTQSVCYWGYHLIQGKSPCVGTARKKILVTSAGNLHDVSSPERKIQFLPLCAGQIGVRLIHILWLFSNQLFTSPSWLNLKKRISQIVWSLKSRELGYICLSIVKMFLKF